MGRGERKWNGDDEEEVRACLGLEIPVFSPVRVKTSRCSSWWRCCGSAMFDCVLV